MITLSILIVLALICALVGVLMGLFSLIGLLASLLVGVLVGALAGHIANRFMGTQTSTGRNIVQGIQGTVQGSGSQPYPSAGELLGLLHDAVAMPRMIEGKLDVVGGFRQCRIFHYITSLCIAMRYIMDALYRFSI